MKKLFCLLLFFSWLFLTAGAHDIVLENASFRYVLSSGGRNLHFYEKSSMQDYLYADTVSYCAYAGNGNPVDSVSLTGNRLSLYFLRLGAVVEIEIKYGRQDLIWEVASVKGKVGAVSFLNVPLRLKGLPGEPFGVCALSLNLYTRVIELPVLQRHLSATCYEQFGIKGGRVAIIGAPVGEMLPVIREILSHENAMPVSRAGGAWASFSKESHGSYIMNFGALTEKTVDEWVGYCKSVGFNQIDNHGGGDDFFSFGDFELNPEKWPEGWRHFSRINERLHQAGISSILHTYAFFADKRSKYVTPVPSADLASFRKFTLRRPLRETDTVVEVNEPLTDISLFTGFHYRNSVTLRIGNELIEFSGVAGSSTFTGCRRGANHTIISAHAAGDTAYHLKELFGKFLPGPGTELFTLIAHRTAEIINECGFDGLYLDAIDGSDILDGTDHAWYYASSFLFSVVNQLKRPVGIEMSLMTHHFWNYRSRWQAWDVSRRGHKRFVDLHVKAVDQGLLLPLQLGWWLNFTWDPPQTEHTFSDDVEYLGCKLIGYNAGLSLLGGYEKKEVDNNPSFVKLNALLRQYEELRHRNYFPEKIKARLREPGKEFTLLKQRDGRWNFRPVVYQKHLLSGADPGSGSWQVHNSFSSQPLRLRIQALLSVAPWDDSAAILLPGVSDSAGYAAAAGVSGGMSPFAGERPSVRFSAFNAGVVPQNGAWVKTEKQFSPWMDLHKQQGLGVWVKGDGNGELLNLRLGSPWHLSTGAKGDHFIKVDFTGWKYFELVELEAAETFRYHWPDSSEYQTHMFSVDFGHVDKLQVWYNNLPPGKKVETLIGPVKALPLIHAVMENPSVVVNGKKIVFPVKMESGMYLEFNSMQDCHLYSSTGKLLADVTPVLGAGVVPVLVKGENQVLFRQDGHLSVNPRAAITIISQGEFLSDK